MKHRKLIHNQNGVALVAALVATTVLVTLALALHKKMNAAYDASIGVYRQTTMSQMAASGIHTAMAMLIHDRVASRVEVDSLQEDWAAPDVIAEAMSEMIFEEGDVTVVVTDERGRIQVNAMVSLPGHDFNTNQEHIWIRLLEFMANHYEPLEDLEYNALIEPLKDWIDSGDNDAITGLNGAESSYYMDLEPPYECRNAPLDHLGDLSRIKGFPPGLFSQVENMPLISDIFTVHGAVAKGENEYTFDGKININTADLPVLAAILPDGYESYAQDMVDYRLEADAEGFINDLSSLTWYKNIPGLEDIDINGNIITNQSDLFRITSTAAIEDALLTTVAVVQREIIEKTGNWRCRVLYWETK